MSKEGIKKTWSQSKILWKEATKYDKIVIAIFIFVFFGLGLFVEGVTHVCYDAITQWNQPAIAEENEVTEENKATEEFVPKTIAPQMTSFGERNGDWGYYVDENTGVLYMVIFSPASGRYGITLAMNADGTPMTRDQLNDPKN